jgi:signal peptidase II
MSGPHEGPNGRLFWGTAAAVVALDLLTKILAEKYLLLHVPREVFGEYARLTLAYNPGAAFSMSLGPYSRWIFGTFAVIALVVLWRIFLESGPTERLKPVALGLAWGGAAGNLVDRVRSPAGVVDFIDIGVGTVRFWTFNVADSAVTVGAILLGWVLLQEDRREKRAKAQAASE